MLHTGKHYLSVEIYKDIRKTTKRFLWIAIFVMIIIASYLEVKISLEYLISKGHLGLRFKSKIMSLSIENVYTVQY